MATGASIKRTPTPPSAGALLRSDAVDAVLVAVEKAAATSTEAKTNLRTVSLCTARCASQMTECVTVPLNVPITVPPGTATVRVGLHTARLDPVTPTAV